MSYLPPTKNVLKATARLWRVKPQTPHHLLLDVLKNLRRVFLKRNFHISTNRRDAQMELAGSSMLRAFAKADFGITFCAKEYIEEEINNKELFVLNVVEPIPPRTISYALLKHQMVSFATKALIDLILSDKP